jgi:TrmH family RNA methyltransferase
MIPRQVTSLQHPLVKRWVKLRENRRFRHEEKHILVSGQDVIQEISQHLPLKTVISTKPMPISCQQQMVVTEEILYKILGHETDDLVAAELAMPEPMNLRKYDFLLVLDQVADPGNVGTIFRTALALGWQAIYMIQGSADPYNDKALRASRAASVRMPWKEGTWEELIPFLKEKGFTVAVADIEGSAVRMCKLKKPLALVLGHETRGPSPEAKKMGFSVTIPMKNEIESLNVASAASILMYHFQEIR